MHRLSPLQEKLTRYCALVHQVERLRIRLVGCSSLPVSTQQWTFWKMNRIHFRKHPPAAPQLSDAIDRDDFQQLVNLHAETWDLWYDIVDDPVSRQGERELLAEIFASLPSLCRMGDSANFEFYVTEALEGDPSDDPQAWYAAQFVQALIDRGQPFDSERPGFFIDKAFEAWDETHQQAFIRWASMPFFPLRGLLLPSLNPPVV